MSIRGANSTSATSAPPDEEDDERWNLQEEIAKVFNTALKRTLGDNTKEVSWIGTCTEDERGDYLCKSIVYVWPAIRKKHTFTGVNQAALALVKNLPASASEMMERCVVCGPGFIRFTLSSQWIAKSIHKMLIYGIHTWARKLPIKKAVVDFSSRSIAEEMNLSHLRSTIIADSLARVIEYSGVVVVRRILLEEHQEISRNDDEVYRLLGVHVEEKSKSLYGICLGKTLKLLRKKGLIKESNGDEVIVIDEKKLPLVARDGSTYSALFDLATLWNDINKEKSDWIVYVADEGQQDYIEMCIDTAKDAGLSFKYPICHVGFGLIEGDDLIGVLDLLYEAKTRCKAALVEQGKANKCTAEELEFTAEALGIGAVKYENLKNIRWTKYTFNFDEMFHDKGNTVVYLQYTHVRICSIIRKFGEEIFDLKKEELILKNEEERELGLHLLRFTEVVAKVCIVLVPHILCEYLYELAEKFNLYELSEKQNFCRADDTNVAGSADMSIDDISIDDTINLLLCEATAVVMRKCFHLLGITPIYKI